MKQEPAMHGLIFGELKQYVTAKLGNGERSELFVRAKARP
jgi:hypothetical protein